MEARISILGWVVLRYITDWGSQVCIFKDDVKSCMAQSQEKFFWKLIHVHITTHPQLKLHQGSGPWKKMFNKSKLGSIFTSFLKTRCNTFVRTNAGKNLHWPMFFMPTVVAQSWLLPCRIFSNTMVIKKESSLGWTWRFHVDRLKHSLVNGQIWKIWICHLGFMVAHGHQKHPSSTGCIRMKWSRDHVLPWGYMTCMRDLHCCSWQTKCYYWQTKCYSGSVVNVMQIGMQKYVFQGDNLAAIFEVRSGRKTAPRYILTQC
jgi:hypothetical protein